MYLLECAPQTDGNGSLPGVVGENMGKEYYQALLQEQEEHYQNRATSLKRQIAQLKQELQEMSDKLKSLQEKKSPKVNGVNYQGTKEQASNDLLEFLHSQIDKAEVSMGAKLPSEYGVIPFESFTSMKVFQLEMGLTRHPEEKPVRKDKRDELVEVIEAGLEVINNPDEEDGQDEDDGVGERQLYSENDFIEGMFITCFPAINRMSQQAFNGVCIFRGFTYLNVVLNSNYTVRTFISSDENITASLCCVLSREQEIHLRRRARHKKCTGGAVSA